MIDAWSGPTPVSNQFPKNEIDGIKKLLGRIDTLRTDLRESTSNLLRTAGIRLTRLGMFIDSSLTVGGSQTVNGPLDVHGTADFDGTTTIGGNAAITGTLSLPAGIIDNDALASPVIPEGVYAIAWNFALTTSHVTKVSVTIDVPAGFTKAVVAVVGRVYAYNPNTTGGVNGVGGDYINSRVNTAGVAGYALGTMVEGNNYSGVNVAPGSRVLTGLTPGSTFTIFVTARTSHQSFSANADNTAELSGNIMWFR